MKRKLLLLPLALALSGMFFALQTLLAATNPTSEAIHTGSDNTLLRRLADYSSGVLTAPVTEPVHNGSNNTLLRYIADYAQDTALAANDWKQNVRAASTANGTLATAFENGDTLDGITLATGDRILLKNQSTASQNGIYTVNASGAPSRATDFDSWAEIPGAVIGVNVGTASASTWYKVASTVPLTGTVDTTAITFSAFISGGAGTGDMLGANNLSDVADAASAFAAIKQSASETATGVVELATNAETVTGTDTARAVTPANVVAKLAAPGAIGGTTPAAITGTTITATTFAGAAGGVTLDASGFDGNLATTDNTLQEVAQKVDDLAVSGSLTATRVGYGSGANALTGEAAFTYDATTNTMTADNIVAAVSFSGPSPLSINNGATGSGELRILEDSDDGTNYASFKVPALAANTAYTMPPDDGTSGQVLHTDGNGVLTWGDDSTGSGSLGSNLTSSTNDITSSNEIITLAGTTENLILAFSGNTATYTSSTGVTTINHPDGSIPAADLAAGTGVTTALGVNVGSAGAVVVNGGALGTPSSGTVTNLTGTASININGTVGATTPTTGAFTTLATSGAITPAENSAIVLNAALSADGKYTGTVIAGTAGATLAFGDVIYLDPTDSRWELTDANSAAAADGDCRGLIGICVLAAAGDGSATTILLSGTVRADAAFPTFTVGAPVYFSETAGDATSTAPTTTDSVSRVIGYSVDGNTIYVCPAGTWTTHT